MDKKLLNIILTLSIVMSCMAGVSVDVSATDYDGVSVDITSLKVGDTISNLTINKKVVNNRLYYTPLINGTRFSSAYVTKARLDSIAQTSVTVASTILYDYKFITMHTITFENYDGTVLQTLTDLDYGTAVEYTGDTPTKQEDDGYTYTFKGWDSAITTATDDKTYTATFTSTPKTYNVTLNKDGGACDDITSYTCGTAITLPIPTKDHYTFDGWYDNEGFEGDAVTAISETDTGDKVYFAKYTFEPYTEIGASTDTENYPSVQGGVENDFGTLRFMWALNMNGTPTINNFGAYIIPFSIFVDDATSLENMVKVEYTDLTEQPADGETFSADITNIPTEHFDKLVYAIPFVNSTFAGTESRLTAKVNDFLN